MGTAVTVVLVALAVVAAILVLMYVGVLLTGASQAWQSRGFERKAAKDWERAAADPSLASRFAGGPFGVGREPSATNVHRGTHAGRSFVAFDYAVTDDLTGDEPVRRQYAVVALEAGHPTPPVSVHRTESPVPLFEEVRGEGVVDVVVDEAAFPRLFRVRTPAPDLATAMLQPGVVHRMTGLPGTSWRLADGWLLAISKVRRAPTQVDYELHLLSSMLDAVPPER